MSSSQPLRLLSLTAIILSLALPCVALAQEIAGTAEIPARLRHLEGTVTVQRAAAGETEDAVINLPLGSGDRVWSADDGRVELMFEDGTTIWMDAGTTLDFVSLPRPTGVDGAILRLWTGSVFVQRPEPDSGALLPLRLDTPSGAVSFDSGGVFRVDLDEEQTVWLSAYDGSAVLDAGGIAERVSAGNRALVQSGNAPSRAVAFNTSEADGFSDWRDARFALYASTEQYTVEREYVPQTIVHYAADLEPYGSWSYHPTFAAWYWRPYAAVAWTPYRDGRWVYTYAGWNWVSSAPWDYVTTHYGRWHYGSGGWIWFPGRVWTPASVNWYVGTGYVGWVPLNYYNQPAVSFGVHVGGGGVGINIGINYSSWGYPSWGYPSWGYPSWGYPSWGWGYPFYGHRPYRHFGGHYAGDGWYGRPVHYPSYRGQAYEVGPIGSASGRGRVVNQRGYSSGLADAWTVVPGDSFSSRNVGRAAVARSALPKGLDQQSKALVSGSLRARQPASMVPTDARAVRATAGNSVRRAVPASGASNAVREAAGSTSPAVSGAQRRAATPSSDTVGRGTVTTGTARATTPSAVRSASAPAAARSTSAPRPNALARAVPRNATASPDKAPAVSGATRQATSRRSNSPTVRTPPSGAQAAGSQAVRSPARSTGAPSSALRTAPSPRSTGRDAPVRSAPATRSRSSVAPPTAARPSGSVRPSGAVRSTGAVRPSGAARPSGSVGTSGAARPSGSVRPSGAARPSGAVRPSGAARPSGAVRPAAAPRPAPSGQRAPSARPASPPRPGGGGKASVRTAKPRGGTAK